LPREFSSRFARNECDDYRPYREGEVIESATSATALSAGWVWRIPLFNRIGTGYVFSSEFKSDDEAIRELSQHLRIDLDTYQPRVIKMRVGRLRRAWVGNCIAVGLSGGFIEPLEATAIMASMVTAFQITRHFPTRSMPEMLRREFNRRIDALYDGIRDFITMQYFLANRPEPFWTAARSPTVLSDTLRDNLELWRYRLPDIDDLRPPHLFNEVSYGINLASKGFYRDSTLFYQENVSSLDWERYGAHLAHARQRVRALPTARDFLLQMRGEETWVYGGGGVPMSGRDVPPSFAGVRAEPAPNV
jgi:Tryptophan halogenase